MLGAIVLLCLCVCVASGPYGRSDGVSLDPKVPEEILEDASLKVPELVRKYGYPLEEHRVTTADGYILTVHRIPHGRDAVNATTKRPVVFIMHGLMSSSADWVLMGPDKGLAYILAEEGFDVWLGNARGNRYSRQHVKLNPDAGADFWDFSWDEIGNIDLPTMIDYALDKADKKRLHYIGHSQGTTSFWVMCSLRPDYNQKIISMNALAPVAYLTHNTCPLIKSLAPLSTVFEKLSKMIGVGEILPITNSKIMRWAGEKLCSDTAIFQEMCTDIIFLIGGWNALEFNRTMLPVILAHTPAGASIRQFAHYGQVTHTGSFRRFNHLGFWNYKVYGTWDPPLYDLSQVKAPVFLRYSLSDPLAHVNDVERLAKELGNLKAKTSIPMSSFSHLDFMWGIDAKKLVYDQVIADMRWMEESLFIFHPY
ncbi:lipase 3-like [Cydia fagiglandana]|uniref:lipase 3-like n=1 Tax=Cydia fagiglandana TaxID=1458189 RepID=UPI002FEE24B9